MQKELSTFTGCLVARNQGEIRKVTKKIREKAKELNKLEQQKEELIKQSRELLGRE